MDATTKTLYETDFAAWADEMAVALRAGRVQELDLGHLAEEVEGLAGAQRKAVRSQLQCMMMHLLKRRIQLQRVMMHLRIQPDRESRGWRISIGNARNEILDEIQDSPSLRPHLEESMERVYRLAVKQALLETGFEEATPKQVPARCPWTLPELLDGDLGSLK